jgi:hypothetical protein
MRDEFPNSAFNRVGRMVQSGPPCLEWFDGQVTQDEGASVYLE